MIRLVDYDPSSEGENEYLRERDLLSDEKEFHKDDTDGNINIEDEEKIMRKKKVVSKKKIRKSLNTFGNGRQLMINPCKELCQNKCSKKFMEIERQDIHEFFWGLGNYDRQKNWLLTCIEKVPIRRRVHPSILSRRQNTYKYSINWNDKQVQVCQQFLLQTLNISQMTLRYTLSNAVQKSAAPDRRGKGVPHNKTSKKVIQEVHDFIKALPAVPSHYCRSKTSRKYLSNDLRNVSFLYRIFLQHREKIKSLNPKPSISVFRSIFSKDFNLGFHHPKKDKCKLCESRKDKDFIETETSQKAFEEHLKMKEQCIKLHLSDQKKHLLDESTICASFDLQKVLNTPHGDNLLLYYSRKYSFYNETVYESGTCDGICYVWGERDGNRGCNEVCTIIFKYLQRVDEKKTCQHLILYCDSCAGQNKNRAMLSMIQLFLQNFAKNLQTIKIVFLLPGHTYMPVDSVHATIERFTKKRIIWAPSEWDTMLTNARVEPKPFEVIRMNYSDFKNWKSLGDLQMPSNTKTSGGDIFKISRIKQSLFTKGHQTFKINYTYDDVSLINVLIGACKKGNL